MLSEKSDETFEVGDYVTIRPDLGKTYYMGWFANSEMRRHAGQTYRVLERRANCHREARLGRCADFVYRLDVLEPAWWTYDMFDHETPEPYIEDTEEMSSFLKSIIDF